MSFKNQPELARQCGTKGGQATKAKYGREHFQRAGAEGGKAHLRQHGRDYFSRLGRMARGSWDEEAEARYQAAHRKEAP